jgi:two-component system, chemotaxis family, sensor kinase CheA
VKVDLLNKLMDLAGELVLARNQLNRTFESQNNPSAELSTIIQNVDFVTSDLQEHIMQTRMQAIASVFGKFPRLVRDLSRQLNKEITLEMQGEEVELDKSILESLSDPLTHLIRNCCDHAIERPEVREKNGNPPAGSISLTADQESGHINITVRDDGAGIDHERIARKALESGVVSEAALRAMSPQEQVNLIFMPGFSTAEAVTDVSGRGVGMDVVRTNIEQIGGSITISTKLGEGTTMSLRLPLTLAIIPSLVVRSCDQIYAVPQINLVELVSVKASQIASRIERVGSASVLRLRGKLLPLVKLSHVLGLDEEYVDPTTGERFAEKRTKLYDARLPQNQTWDNNGEEIEPATSPVERRQDGQSDYNILVLKAGNKQYGLIVDEIRDIEEIVVKPLSSFLKNCKCFSGATIMGDGKVAMILDVAGIISLANLSFAEDGDAKQNKQKKLLAEDGQASQSILLLSNGANEVFALPLSAILRLEKIQMSSIEKIGNQKFLPYQGRSMSLVFLHEHLPVTPLASDMEEGYLIIPKQGNATTELNSSNIRQTAVRSAAGTGAGRRTSENCDIGANIGKASS